MTQRKIIINNLKDADFRDQLKKIFVNKYKIDKEIVNRLSFKISPKDGMLNNSIEHYLFCGANAIQTISKLVKKNEHLNINNILDFPTGYGRVNRWLRASFPNASLYGVDLIDTAINYCCDEFYCQKLPSSLDVSKYQFNTTFDIIWCGSIFTHLNETDSTKLIKTLLNSLTTNGILLTTLHGDFVYNRLKNSIKTYNLSSEKILSIVREYDNSKSGFCFQSYNSDNPKYGISLTNPKWVSTLQSKLFEKSFSLCYYEQRGWADHQDILVIKRLNN